MESNHRISQMTFKDIYGLYVQKIQRKGQALDPLDTVICWQTGYTPTQLQGILSSSTNLLVFLQKAPHPNPKRFFVHGNICGVKVETIDDPFMREVRILDKLVDDIAKGKKLDRILPPTS